MRFDETRYDGVVIIGHVRTLGLWSAQTNIIKGRITRVAGQFKDATADTLLCLALHAGLQVITNRQATEVAARRGVDKLRLQVLSSHCTYLGALRDDLAGNQSLHVGRSLFSRVEQQASRFDLTMETLADTRAISTLCQWAEVNVLHADSPFVPSVLSVRGKSSQITGGRVHF